jgi:L-ascorbate metabolism protein UlaG (beta-lactamase superfamily)
MTTFPRLRRTVRYVAVALCAFLAFLLTDAWKALGTRATGARRARMERSPEWSRGQFVNPQPIVNDLGKSLHATLHAGPYVVPLHPVPTVIPDPKALATPPASGLRVTWFGHSSTLLEIDGVRILTDPLWSDRASPLDWTGPTRWYAPPIALRDLPPIDAVVVSHDHYDHLDQRTIVALKDSGATFVVPLGIGADLAYWGVPEDRIVELDWWDRTRIRDLEIVSTPSRHASGRGVTDRDAKLWSGFAFVGARHRVYYSGDSGLFPALRDIGDRLGPFDLTMIEIGQYDQGWPDWHMGPEQAALAHTMVRGKVFLPVHWGALALAAHGWTEPIERALLAATRAGVTIVTPEPGESVDPTAPRPPTRWWPSLPWRTAEDYPIRSSQVE